MLSTVYQTLSVLRGSPRYNQWLYSQFAPYLEGDVLDIGSGLGDIARQFNAPSIRRVILSDYADEMIDTLKTTTLPLADYRIMKMNIADPQLQKTQPGAIADTITCINVLEHIEDHVLALKNMKYLLKPGGKIVIFVPAIQAIYGTLDVHVEHFRRYHRRTLAEAFFQAGFTVESKRYMNFFGIFTWFFAGRILRQKKFHSQACNMLDKCVPALRTLEEIVKPPLGQSIIMVGKVTNS